MWFCDVGVNPSGLPMIFPWSPVNTKMVLANQGSLDALFMKVSIEASAYLTACAISK